MPNKTHQPHFGTWLNLPPPGDERVGPAVKYRCTLLQLLYWGIQSAVPQAGNNVMEVGPSFSPWIAALELTPFILVPAFLCLVPRTGSQWRALMIAAYAGLALCLLLNLSLPSHGSWGDLPLAGPYGTLAWPADGHREWLITLPRFSSFWSLLIYVSLSSAGTSPILRLLALVWWFLLCLAPINTGIMGYADLLGPLVIIAAILACMHLADKRNA